MESKLKKLVLFICTTVLGLTVALAGIVLIIQTAQGKLESPLPYYVYGLMIAGGFVGIVAPDPLTKKLLEKVPGLKGKS